MDVYAFQAKWMAAQGSNRSLAQSHFPDLGALAGLLGWTVGFVISQLPLGFVAWTDPASL